MKYFHQLFIFLRPSEGTEKPDWNMLIIEVYSYFWTLLEYS